MEPSDLKEYISASSPSPEEIAHDLAMEKEFLKTATPEQFETYFVDDFFDNGDSGEHFNKILSEIGREDLLPHLEIFKQGTENYNPLEGSFEWDFTQHKLVEEAED